MDNLVVFSLLIALGGMAIAIFYQDNCLKLKAKLALKDKEIQAARLDAVKKSKDVTRGKIAEEFIPLFPDFPYNMSDCKFSGAPLDFLVFKGMSDVRDGVEGARIDKIIFADVKVNKSARSKVQNAIKDAIDNERVIFETWQIDENKTIKIK